MAITALLDLHVKPETLGPAWEEELSAILKDTRAFDGCLGVEVLVDSSDPGHVVAVERWESEEHDAAYRAWRTTDAGQTDLGAYLAGAPTLTKFTTADGI